MRLIIIQLLFLLVGFVAGLNGQIGKHLLQAHTGADTITVRFSMCETERGDTVMFRYPSKYEGLCRYFNRNLRFPLDDSDTIPFAICRLYFLIDTTGRVTNAYCATGAPDTLAKEVIRVAGRLGNFTPVSIKGKPVATWVDTRVVFYDMSEDEAKTNTYRTYENDIFVGALRGCRLPDRNVK